MFSFILWSQVYDIVCVCYVGVGERGVWRELVLPLKQLPIFCVHTFSLFSICFFLSKHVFQTNLLIVYFPGKYTMTGESIDIYSGYVLFWGCLKPRLSDVSSDLRGVVSARGGTQESAPGVAVHHGFPGLRRGFPWRVSVTINHFGHYYSIIKLHGWWVGTWMDYDFPYIGNVIIPTDLVTTINHYHHY